MSGEAEKVDLKADVEAGLSDETGSTIKDIEYTDVEIKAMDDGWIPPDRFDKADTGKDFISAEKFLENGSFFKKINSQKEKIEQLQSNFEKLNSHYEKVAENEHKKAEAEYKAIIDELKAQKVEAISEGDGKRVVEIDDAIERTEKPVKEVEPESDPVFSAWAAENKWYEEDKFLSVEADGIAERYLAKGLRGKDLLDAMTEHVKTLHPDKFEKVERKRPASVEGDTGGGVSRKTSKNVSERDLTADERDVFRNFDRMEIFKTDEARTKYIKEVIELRE